MRAVVFASQYLCDNAACPLQAGNHPKNKKKEVHEDNPPFEHKSLPHYTTHHVRLTPSGMDEPEQEIASRRMARSSRARAGLE